MNMPMNPSAFNDLVTPALRTTSRIIAAKFEKQHGHVMRDIRALIEASPEWGVSNFGETPYVDPQNGQTYQMYEMTRDGYSMLVMGFTGRPAMEWKIKFLAAFNAMEAQLRAQAAAPVIDLNDPAQLVPLLTSYAQRTQIAEAKVAEQQPKVEAFDRIEASDGCLGVRQASKVLAYPERKLTKWLETHGWAFRQSGKGPLQAYVAKRQQGYMEHRLDAYKDPETQEPRTRIQLVITPKGVARLAQVLPSEGRA